MLLEQKIAMTKFISDLDLRYYLDFFVDRGRGFQRFLAWLQTDPSQTALLHAIMNGNGSNSNSSGSISSSSSSTDIITVQSPHRLMRLAATIKFCQLENIMYPNQALPGTKHA